jgi:hypothetical protein
MTEPVHTPVFPPLASRFSHSHPAVTAKDDQEPTRRVYICFVYEKGRVVKFSSVDGYHSLCGEPDVKDS